MNSSSKVVCLMCSLRAGRFSYSFGGLGLKLYIEYHFNAFVYIVNSLTLENCQEHENISYDLILDWPHKYSQEKGVLQALHIAKSNQICL